MRVRVFLLIGAVLLSGCGVAISEGCPRIPTYAPDVQAHAANELEALPASSVLPDFIGDYAVMREELRAGGC
ncbi:hypothetical protein [Planktotalea sp.]|uniref:hypothetical protein n=1 Tax=Planktotalea sp. TaxID=2029877 RepID=UPI003D6A9484